MSPTLGQVNGQEMDPAPSQTQSQQCLGTAEGTVRESTDEDMTKEIKRRLEKRGIPADDWQYYVESPHSWDYSKVASSGLSKGVEVVLLSPTTCTPSWVERGSMSRFIQLRGKLTELMLAKSEIENFIQSKAPDDNQLLAAYKQAGKKADKLQSELQAACNALASMTIEDDECFGEDFLSSLMEFSQEMAKKNNAQEKVESLKTLLTNRGIVMHPTNIDSDQVKSQLPIFTWTSSLSIVGAIDTWTKILSNSGIHRQVWGNIIINRIQDPALSNIPLSVKREKP